MIFDVTKMYLCKKTYCRNPNRVTLRTIKIVFRKGVRYKGYSLHSYYQMLGDDNKVHCFHKSEFNECFHTIAEMREIEIEKIIKL
tara:strand:- start:22954 stop:23208 length:255 start_codon:yes stop_codon:yes gene_type:complete